MRGFRFGGGSHVIVCAPRPRRCVTVEITFGTFTVRVTSIAIVAGSFSRKSTSTWSRNPSPFGEIVVSSGPSPAKAVEPLSARSPTSFGGVASIRTGAVASTAER